MIRGQVMPSEDYSTGLEARISVEIVAANQIFQTLESVVDTGFEGAFTLPEWVARELGLHSTGTRPLTLASGQTIQTDTCVARLLWHGLPVDARAYVMGKADDWHYPAGRQPSVHRLVGRRRRYH